MNKAHLIITAITLQGPSYRQAAHRFAVTESSRHGDNRVDSQQPINKMLHLGVGREHNKTEVIALIHGLPRPSSPQVVKSSATTTSTLKRVTKRRNEKHLKPHFGGSGVHDVLGHHIVGPEVLWFVT